LQKALGHELPNQLTALLGLVRILELEETKRLSADGQEYLHRLAAVARRADGLIKALVELIRIIQEPQTAEPVDVIEAAREAAAEISQLFPGRSIDYQFSDVRPVIQVSRAALRRVLLHLLRNAVQAAVAERPLRIELGAAETPDVVAFWVADNGRGLTEEQQRRLFEPFALHDPAATGTGLGLVLVRQLVARWGGDIQAQSTAGRGTRFTITLRRCPPGGP
jgi:two-component system sensor histidine kinase HydH